MLREHASPRKPARTRAAESRRLLCRILRGRMSWQAKQSQPYRRGAACAASASGSGELCHLLGDGAMLFRADESAELGGGGRPPLAQKALFRLAIALERGLDALERQPLVLDSMDHGFERLRLEFDIPRCRVRTSTARRIRRRSRPRQLHPACMYSRSPSSRDRPRR